MIILKMNNIPYNINNILNIIKSDCPDISKSLRNEYVINNVIQSKRLTKKSIFSHFPIFKKYFNKTSLGLREILYCLINDIDFIPLCKICHKNYTPLRNYKVGFQKTCSKECSFKCIAQKQTIQKIKITKRAKYINLVKQNPLSPYILDNALPDSSSRNYLILNDYCKHGDVRIHRKIYYNFKSWNIKSSMCFKCNEELFLTYIPSKFEITSFQRVFNDFYNKHSLAMKYTWWIMYYPKYLKIILIYYQQHINNILLNKIYYPEAYHCFLFNITKPETCTYPGCSNLVKFSNSSHKYRVFCDIHSVGYNSSGKEYELEEFIKSLNVKYTHNERNVISKELDFYFSEHKIAIEFNGVWFHSTKFKSKDYHENKYKECKEKDIELISIWEDILINKSDYLKNFIKRKLHLLKDNNIDINECIIKEITIEKEITDFINEYSLYEYSNKFKYFGIFFNDNLLTILCINKLSNITYEIKFIDSMFGYDMTLYYSKLLKYIFNHVPNIKYLIVNNNCDLSNEYDLKSLGFKNIDYRSSWLFFNNRTKTRVKSSELEKTNNKCYYKCYSSGVIKLIYVVQ